ncbi:hypothetical protein EHM69_04145 [candidate division KSB1 bacterium]|nr:MAG: hypothetical protein EHM69_04145 [candidate division KSB1 bacterium]
MKSAYISILLTLLIIPGIAQGFGKNKVQYEKFDWRYIQSEHFDVYFARGAEGLAEFTAETAEIALEQIEKSWNYDLDGRITIITYRSHNNFQQTNVTTSMPEESEGGFTEFLKNRVVLPFTGNYEDYRHVIHHEVTHAVNMRMFYGSGFQSILVGVMTSDIPLWFTEGIAEYESRRGWDVEADMFMRDATISGYLPKIDDLYGYFAYKGGQSVFYYLDRKYGAEKVGEFVNKVKNTGDVERAFKQVVGVDKEEFNRQWQNWLRRIYWPTVADLRLPTDFAERMTDHTEWRNFVNNGSAISPDGTQIVFLSDRTDYFDVWLVDVDSGKLKRLLKGERSGNFEQMKWLDARISWSPDGKQVTFASKAGNRDAVNILDIQKQKITRRLSFSMDGLFNPAWSPDGDKIVFVGMRNGQSDLYYYDLTNDSLVQVTNDIFSDDDPAWSLDSRSLVFTSDRQDSTRIWSSTDNPRIWSLDYRQSDLYRIRLGEDTAERLTYTSTNERMPTFLYGGKYLVYTSDENGIYNLYRYDLELKTSEAVTNCLTGCLQPSASLGTQRLVFTSLTNGGYDVFLLKNVPELPAIALRPTNFRLRGSPEPHITTESEPTQTSSSANIREYLRPFSRYIFARGAAEEGSDIRERALADTITTRKTEGGFFSKKYRVKFTPDYVHAAAAYSSFFGAQGTGQILFSDVLGNQLIYVNTDLYYDFNHLDNTNFSVQYFYLPRRINYGLGLFRYVYYLDGGNLQDQTVELDLNLSYPFTKYDRVETNIGFYAVDRADWWDYPVEDYRPLARRRVLLPELAYIHDTVLWGITGPMNGSRYRLSYAYSPRLGDNGKVNRPYAEFYTVKGDMRDYFRLGRDYSWASRFTAGLSGGPNPQNFFLGGVSNWINRHYENNEIPDEINDFYFSSFVTPFRGGDYFERRGTGNRFFLTNQEFRFPAIETLQLRWPLPMTFRYIRGALFTDIGAAWKDNQFKLTAVDSEGKRRLADPQIAYGYGLRAWVGFFVLRWDLAWATDGVDTSKPRYYFSIGSEF